MKFSVVIPVYNAAETLASSIESVLNQTLEADEVILVDDGSSDESATIAAGFGGRIKWIQQENQGSAIARNRGIEEAKNDYIAFLDSDDLWCSDYLEKQSQLLEQHPALSLCFCSFENLDLYTGAKSGKVNSFEETPLKDCRHKMLGEHGYLFEESTLPYLLLQCPIVTTSTVIAKRQTLLDLGCFDPSLRRGQDLDLWLRMSQNGTIAWIDKVYVSRRLHVSNITNDSLNTDIAQVRILGKWNEEKIEWPETVSKKSYLRRISSYNYSIGRRLGKARQFGDAKPFLFSALKYGFSFKRAIATSWVLIQGGWMSFRAQ